MASAYEHFYGEDRRHACPLIGHMEGTPRKGVYYDMNGEFYVPYTELLWWQDDEHSDLTDRHHGIQMTVPSGPDYDPWVTTFLVDRDKPETTINWAVSTNVDVKGFKVYHVPSSGERSQVGPELVRVKSVDDLAYTCADSQDRPAGCYVLELVRNTPDKTRYLYPEGITR